MCEKQEYNLVQCDNMDGTLQKLFEVENKELESQTNNLKRWMWTKKILKLNIFALFIEFELIDALLKQKYSQTCYIWKQKHWSSSIHEDIPLLFLMMTRSLSWFFMTTKCCCYCSRNKKNGLFHSSLCLKSHAMTCRKMQWEKASPNRMCK